MEDYKKKSKDELITIIRQLQGETASPLLGVLEGYYNIIYDFTRLSNEPINLEDEDVDKKMASRAKAANEAKDLLQSIDELKQLIHPELKGQAELLAKGFAEKMADLLKGLRDKREQDKKNRLLISGKSV